MDVNILRNIIEDVIQEQRWQLAVSNIFDVKNDFVVVGVSLTKDDKKYQEHSSVLIAWNQ